MTFISSKLEAAIWPRDTGQWIPCFDRCQLIETGKQGRYKPIRGAQTKNRRNQTSEGLIIFNLKWWHRWKFAIIIICIFYHGASRSYRSKKPIWTSLWLVFFLLIFLGFCSSWVPCPHVSEIFLIRNFFFPDVTASVHTHPANLAANPDIWIRKESDNLWTVSPHTFKSDGVDKNASSPGEQ